MAGITVILWPGQLLFYGRNNCYFMASQNGKELLLEEGSNFKTKIGSTATSALFQRVQTPQLAAAPGSP